MDLSLVKDLGLTGFAMLLLWWMYQDSMRRLDLRDDAMRKLEYDIRNRFASQLQEAANALAENGKTSVAYAEAMVKHSKIMQEVVKLLTKLNHH